MPTLAPAAPPPAAPIPTDPASLNGDLPLSYAQRDAYLAHHARRNAENARESRRLGIRTRAGPRPAPARPIPGLAASSPARVYLHAFFAHAAALAADRFRDRPVTIADIGCGNGLLLSHFADAGLRGRYIGLDIARSPKWADGPLDGPGGRFERELRIGDIHTLDPASLPTVDILVSATALEHIRDDLAVLAALTARLAPDALQAHLVPAEAALPLYGLHGWRQYSPRCLRDRWPDARIYRYGGAATFALHRRAITAPTAAGKPAWPTTRPRLYTRLRNAALALDTLTGHRRPAVYGVVAGCGDVELGR